MSCLMVSCLMAHGQPQLDRLGGQHKLHARDKRVVAAAGIHNSADTFTFAAGIRHHHD